MKQSAASQNSLFAGKGFLTVAAVVIVGIVGIGIDRRWEIPGPPQALIAWATWIVFAVAVLALTKAANALQQVAESLTLRDSIKPEDADRHRGSSESTGQPVAPPARASRR